MTEDGREQLTPIKRALLEIRDLRARLEHSENRYREPIAIVGMGLRFPGGAHDLASFWRLLAEGKDAITEIPADRWDREAYFDPDPLQPGKMNVRHGGFIEGVDQFDAEFFSISPREAASMDPQHRMLLEVCWEALEHAGESAARLAGSQTGVFIGMANGDYLRRLYADPEQIDLYAASGNGFSLASGRISYLLGVHGPSITVDTACSSSLVALHLACRSLRLGESELALAGGVNLILAPELHINLAKARILAPDGRCKSFAATADGYARSEGCGVAVLKPLSAALADRNHILAVIRGSAVNQDGRSAGITAPNGPAQEAVIRAALQDGGVAPEDITYAEAHGTGTALGDPIEVQALAAALGRNRVPQHPLLVGSVKTNIGHLEGAAGMAGLAKTILMLQHRAIPPHLHLGEKNPAVDWKSLPISIPTELTPWPDSAPPTVGLSSFGMSGTNAHVVLEAGPVAQKTKNDPERPLHMLALSAGNETALRELSASYGRFLGETESDIADVCFTANAGRTTFKHRLAAVGENTAEIRAGLADSLSQPRPAEPRSTPRIAFVYTGQGAQHPGMGAQLYRTSPTFREAIDHCEQLLLSCMDRKLTDILFPAEGDESLINKMDYAQPANFALQYALTQLWRSWGLEPAIVAGHSLGEFAAACTAGIFNLSDGLRLVAARGRILGSLPPEGGMMAVFAPEEKVRAAIIPFASRLSLAAVNGRENCVVSGGLAELDLLAAYFLAEGVNCHRLNVATASHSPLLDPVLGEFEAVAQTVTYSPSRIGFVSNVTGAVAGVDQPLSASYWRQHLRSTVRFAAGLETLYQQGVRHFLELGPKPVLGAVGMDSHAAECKWYGSLTPLKPDWKQMLESLQGLYQEGASVDWAGFDRDYQRNKVSAPTYPFQRQSYWREIARPSVLSGSTAIAAARRAGSPGTDWFYQVVWEPEGSAEQATISGPEVAAQTESRNWIVFSGAHAASAALAEALRRDGRPVTTVSAGQSYHRAKGHIVVDPHCAADFERAIQESANGSQSEILFLWGLDSGSGNLAADIAATCSRAVYALRAAVVGGSRLWIVTCGAQHAANVTAPAAEQAALWGLGRTISLEHPETWGGLLDLDPQDAPEQQASRLIESISQGDGEDQIIFRDGVRLHGRLDHAKVVPPVAFSARPDGCYLITGGFGGLGPKIARWLADCGARHLVLVGRRGLPERASWSTHDRTGDMGKSIAAVEELETLGVRVEPVSADITVRSQMVALFSRFGGEWPPLRGIVHAAVLAAASPVCELNETRFMEMFAAKIDGTQLLLELGAKHPLDFAVLFSSLAGVIGSSGGAHYSAASTYLDAAAHVGRSKGLPVTSISWGAWDEMRNASEEARNRFRAGGLIPLPSEPGMKAMGMAVASGVSEISIAIVDWKTLRTVYELRRPRPFLTKMRAEASPSDAGAGTAGRDEELRGRLSTASIEERREIIRAALQQAVARVLGIKKADSIDCHKGLLEMGMDSLMSIELITVIKRQFAVNLALQSLFKFATLERLADRVAELLPEMNNSVTESIAPRTATERRLSAIWVSLLQREPIGIRDRCFDHNGSAALRDQMLNEVRRAFGVAAEGIPVNATSDGLTIESLARLIDENLEMTSTLVVPLQPRGSKNPIFLIHAGGGYVFFYRALAARLAPDQPLYAIRAEMPEDRLNCPFEQTKSIEELATRYIGEIKAIRPKGPYLLGGACFGGVMAYEMARQLRAAGEEIGPLLMFDSFVLNNKFAFRHRISQQLRALRERPIGETAWHFSAGVAKRVLPAPVISAARKLRGRVGAVRDKSAPPGENPGQLAMAHPGLPEKQRKAFEACMRTATHLLETYKPHVCEGEIVLFRAAQGEDPVPYWTNLGRAGMVVHAIPGGHLDMMEEPAVEITAARVREHADGFSDTRDEREINQPEVVGTR